MGLVGGMHKRILQEPLWGRGVPRLADVDCSKPDHLTAERDLLLEVLEESQSLLASLLHEQRPENEIEEQIIENRRVINHVKKGG